MKLRVTDKLALGVLLLLAVLWASSYFRRAMIIVDWRSGVAQGPSIAPFAIHHSDGGLQLIRGSNFGLTNPPVAIVWGSHPGQGLLAIVMGEGEVRKTQILPGLVYEESGDSRVTNAATLTVPYAYPFLLVAAAWASLWLWRRWRAKRLVPVTPSLK